MHVAQQLLDVTVDDVSRLALHSLWLGHVEDIWKNNSELITISICSLL